MLSYIYNEATMSLGAADDSGVMLVGPYDVTLVGSELGIVTPDFTMTLGGPLLSEGDKQALARRILDTAGTRPRSGMCVVGVSEIFLLAPREDWTDIARRAVVLGVPADTIDTCLRHAIEDLARKSGGTLPGAGVAIGKGELEVAASIAGAGLLGLAGALALHGKGRAWTGVAAGAAAALGAFLGIVIVNKFVGP